MILLNVSRRMVPRLAMACLLALSFRGEIAAQDTSAPSTSNVPTGLRSESPSSVPSVSILPTVTAVPTGLPSESPSSVPSVSSLPTVTAVPTGLPSESPSSVPSVSSLPTASAAPTPLPSESPSSVPSGSSLPTASAAPTPLESAVPTLRTACYKNLTLLFEDQEKTNPFVQKTFTLCPDTTFNIGFSDSGGECCFDGMRYLSARKNTRFQCGEDGKIENNCIITGGESHVVYVSLINDEDGDNVEFAGITFVDAKLVTLFLGNSGDISFIDCIFRSHINSGLAFISYFDFGRRLQHDTRDSLAIMKEAFEEHGKIQRGEVEEPKGVDRALQERRQTVVFDGCLFEDNAQDEFSAFTEYGIITIRTDVNDLVVRNTVFRFNLFGNEEIAGRDGYAISNFSKGSTVVIENSCLVDNDFIGFGAIHAWAGSEINLSGNTVEGIDDDLTCQFVATSEIDNPLEESEVACIDTQRGSCPLIASRSPAISVATPAPSKSPSSASSGAATKRLGAALALLVSTISLFGLL